jgi:hypothetical protein
MKKPLKIRRPTIAGFDEKQQRELEEEIRKSDYSCKELILETLDFIKSLMGELKTGKITTAELRKILFNLDPEVIKKLMREH